jgi:hypothetical protein
VTLEDARRDLDPCGVAVFEQVKKLIYDEEEKYERSKARHEEPNLSYRSLGWGQMGVIPLPRLDLDSGRIERDIRGSLMQTPTFLLEEDGQDEKSLSELDP